jgi:hypothetical protein
MQTNLDIMSSEKLQRELAKFSYTEKPILTQTDETKEGEKVDMNSENLPEEEDS